MADDKEEVDTEKFQERFDKHMMEEKQQAISHQYWLFKFILSIAVLLLAIAFFMAYRELAGVPTTGEVTILALIITAPVILLLALMRYVFGDHEKPISQPSPTLLLNVGKELATVIKDVVKK